MAHCLLLNSERGHVPLFQKYAATALSIVSRRIQEEKFKLPHPHDPNQFWITGDISSFHSRSIASKTLDNNVIEAVQINKLSA